MAYETKILRAALTAAFLMGMLNASSAYQFPGPRWSVTAVDGGGLTLGDGTTLTWSIVPDGTFIPGEGTSDLIADFDAAFGETNTGTDLTNRTWFTHFEAAFDRIGELTGNTYLYEPNDDGSTHNSTTNRGIVGVRGDVRIAGNFVDGGGNTLAYNFFPQDGDMVLDTGDMAFFSNPTQNYRRLRNTIMHEHGHGLGFAHVESDNARFLMEPFLQTNFDGPQLDDIRGFHRAYGDQFEGDGGNQTAATATDIGSFGDGDAFLMGADGRGLFVTATETDFVSIGDNGDTDFYAFDLTENAEVSIDLTPVGPTYSQGPQGGNQSSVITSQVMNLTLALFDTDQSTQLAIANSAGNGATESITSLELEPGRYYVRATGAGSATQLYELGLGIVGTTMSISGDFDNDGDWDCSDVNMLTAVTAAQTHDPNFDMTQDGLVNGDDIDAWLVEGGANNVDRTGGNPFVVGDANLDGVNDGQDFILWNEVKFTGNTDWCLGNFNGDAVTDGQDFILWNTFKFTGSQDAVSAVPEPSALALMALAFLGLAGCRRR